MVVLDGLDTQQRDVGFSGGYIKTRIWVTQKFG